MRLLVHGCRCLLYAEKHQHLRKHAKMRNQFHHDDGCCEQHASSFKPSALSHIGQSCIGLSFVVVAASPQAPNLLLATACIFATRIKAMKSIYQKGLLRHLTVHELCIAEFCQVTETATCKTCSLSTTLPATKGMHHVQMHRNMLKVSLQLEAEAEAWYCMCTLHMQFAKDPTMEQVLCLCCVNTVKLAHALCQQERLHQQHIVTFEKLAWAGSKG